MKWGHTLPINTVLVNFVSGGKHVFLALGLAVMARAGEQEWLAGLGSHE